MIERSIAFCLRRLCALCCDATRYCSTRLDCIVQSLHSTLSSLPFSSSSSSFSKLLHHVTRGINKRRETASRNPPPPPPHSNKRRAYCTHTLQLDGYDYNVQVVRCCGDAAAPSIFFQKGKETRKATVRRIRKSIKIKPLSVVGIKKHIPLFF